jgi:phosphatidylglycerophosphate synthase
MVGAPGLAALLAAFTAGPCLAALLDALPHVDHAAPAEGAGLVVHDGRSRELARRRLLHAMRKPTDGFVARHLNRYVSLFLTRFLILVRLTPNTVSFGNLGLGIGAAILAGLGDYTATLIGALLFQLTSIIDGCDGEVAKLTFRDSSKGAWIDTFCDQAGYLVFFIGLPIGLSRAAEPALGLAGGVYLALGGLTLAVIPLLFLVMHRYVRRAGAGGSMLKILEDVQAAAALPGWRGRLNALVFRLSFVFRRDFFAAGALVLCAAGLSWLLMFMIAGSCLGMLLYLLYFSRGGVRA